MHVHILGVCGTFMAGIAALAREAGHRVTGSDAHAWPPMSTQLAALGIQVMRADDLAQLDPEPDVVVVGNVISRGQAVIEAVLDRSLAYLSGPQWLAEHVLPGRTVLAVAGTHGKTSTTSLIAWMLDRAGLEPGFLVGGVPVDFGVSARLGRGLPFVIEADEYDTAFFDKRSKFVHYRPTVAVLNNLEYDHADIFPDLASIERQFHHLVRSVPGRGRLIVNGGDEALVRVLEMGCWTPVERFDVAGGWHAEGSADDYDLCLGEATLAHVHSPLAGHHNRSNTLAAIAACAALGVAPADAVKSLTVFRGVKRRLELRGSVNGVEVYDDFAHHPTAIAATIDALLRRGPGRVLAVLEPRSNTMRLGQHAEALAASLSAADACFVYARPDLRWNAAEALAELGHRVAVFADLDALIEAIGNAARPQDRVLVMSNGDFGGIHLKLLSRLGATSPSHEQ